MATVGSEERNALTVLWRIEDATPLEANGCELIMSSFIRPRTLGEESISFDFFPCVMSGNDKSVCQVRLWYGDDGSLGFPIDCEWSFVGRDGSTLVGGNERNLKLQGEPHLLTDCPTHEEVFVTRKSEFLPNDTLTLRFRITKSNGDLSDSEFVSCRTREDTLDHSFLWPISGFSSLKLNAEVTTSVSFNNFGLGNEFKMKLMLVGESLEEAVVNVKLVPVSVVQYLLVHMEISILDKRLKVFKSEVSEPQYFPLSSDNYVELPDFASRKELMEKKSDCLKEDVLTLLCEIHAFVFNTFIEKHYYGCEITRLGSFNNFLTYLNASRQTTKRRSVPPSTSEDGRTSLAEDFLKLYKDQNFTDFKLQSRDITFPVHRAVLVARSPVFQAMFSSDMKESESDSMDVPDLDSHTLNRFLTFLYTGTVEKDLGWESAVKLYYAADKYQVASLKEQCSVVLRSEISVSNVSDILSLADRHQDEELTSFVHDFAVRHFDEVIQSKEWKSFTQRDSALAGNTMIDLYTKKLQSKLP